MRFRLSMFVDAFLGSGVPLAGEPITAFQSVALLGLRTATVVDNCNPNTGDVVKVLFILTNCGHKPLEVVLPRQLAKKLDRAYSNENAVALLPGESSEYSVFRSWDTPGERQLTLTYEARCAGHPFARLTYPEVAIYVRSPVYNKLIHWIRSARMAHLQSK